MADPEKRSWEKLPREALYRLFRILGAVEILLSVQLVCRSWRRLALEPDLWSYINLSYKRRPLIDDTIADKLARIAIDRSCGNVKSFSLELCASDDLLTYLADRATGLKCLVLIGRSRVTYKGLVEFVRKCPTLEELEITNCFHKAAYGDIGRAHPELRCFRLNNKYIKFPQISGFNPGYDGDALAIASSMHQLRELQLVGNLIAAQGLIAILDNCHHLESLDIRCCFNVNMEYKGLKEKLAKIKNVKLPNDSTADYPFDTRMEPAETAAVIDMCLSIYLSFSLWSKRAGRYYDGYDEE